MPTPTLPQSIAQLPITPDQFNALIEKAGILGAFGFIMMLIIMISLVGWMRRESARTRVRLRELELEGGKQSAQSKLDEIHAQEGRDTAALTTEMVREYIAAMKASTDTNKMIAAAIERSASESMAHARAITDNTNATFQVNTTMQRLPDAIGAQVAAVGEKNAEIYKQDLGRIAKSVVDLSNETAGTLEALLKEIRETRVAVDAILDHFEISVTDAIRKSTNEIPVVKAGDTNHEKE